MSNSNKQTGAVSNSGFRSERKWQPVYAEESPTRFQEKTVHVKGHWHCTLRKPAKRWVVAVKVLRATGEPTTYGATYGFPTDHLEDVIDALLVLKEYINNQEDKSEDSDIEIEEVCPPIKEDKKRTIVKMNASNTKVKEFKKRKIVKMMEDSDAEVEEATPTFEDKKHKPTMVEDSDVEIEEHKSTKVKAVVNGRTLRPRF